MLSTVIVLYFRLILKVRNVNGITPASSIAKSQSLMFYNQSSIRLNKRDVIIILPISYFSNNSFRFLSTMVQQLVHTSRHSHISSKPTLIHIAKQFKE